MALLACAFACNEECVTLTVENLTCGGRSQAHFSKGDSLKHMRIDHCQDLLIAASYAGLEEVWHLDFASARQEWEMY